MLTKKRIKGFITYFLVACVGFSVNIGSRIVYSDVLNIRFSISVTAAYLTAMVVGFILTKMFAFDARNTGNVYREAIKFFIVSMVALSVTLVFSLVALSINSYILETNRELHNTILSYLDIIGYKFINRQLAAHLFGIGIGFFANFFGHKYLTFKTTGAWDKLLEKREAIKTRRS